MRSHFIDNYWIEGDGKAFHSINPATGEVIWTGKQATEAEVDQAVRCARQAFDSWSNTPLEDRIMRLEMFQEQLQARYQELAECIAQETGKPQWDSASEVDAMIGKIRISIESYGQRTGETHKPVGEAMSVTRHRPHGVVAVIGPYNFPGHLPNGHIVPAILAGNTVIFKPSDLTPLTAQKLVECWYAAGLPPGVLNLIQGGGNVGKSLSQYPDLNGLFFTGSVETGYRLFQQLNSRPDIILALEMGGNNPLIVIEVDNIPAAVYHTIQSAFLTSGQRCTCARRLIVPRGEEGDEFLERLKEKTATLRIGPWNSDPEPFMGPMISVEAAKNLLKHQKTLLNQGGIALLKMEELSAGHAFVSPGLIDVTPIAKRGDIEIFGPLLQIIRVSHFEAALDEANNTRYGLSAGLLSSNEDLYHQFYRQIRAGIVNWNRPLTGASSRAPFGGTGLSGNYRPGAWYAADYCAYPVASLESDHLHIPQKLPPGLR